MTIGLKSKNMLSMRKGFLFDHRRCVNCGACSAACILENGWIVSPRNILTLNSGLNTCFPLINVSLACNHCEKAVCLEGCPASAYHRDAITGAVIIDENKCIGCKYCQWNCPYDAPRFDEVNKTIGKCSLCNSLLIEGGLPACTNGCPTGALSFGDISDTFGKFAPEWFPDKNLNPAVVFTSPESSKPLRILPEGNFVKDGLPVTQLHSIVSDEWSLVVFSFLSTLSVASVITSVFNGISGKILFSSLIILAGLISLSHLGKKMRAWRAVLNIKSSPLSREIAIYSLFSVVSLIAIFSEVTVLLFTAAILGLLLLIVIDSVYLYADNRKYLFLHSGQTFISGLLIVSFFSGQILPFLFLALLKLISLLIGMSRDVRSELAFKIRFFRMAMLLISGIALLSGISKHDNAIPVLFLIGEFLDRILFYIDFNPLNIKKLINMKI